MPPNSAFSISAFYLICVPLRVSIAVWAWDDRELTRHQPPSTVAARRIPAVATSDPDDRHTTDNYRVDHFLSDTTGNYADQNRTREQGAAIDPTSKNADEAADHANIQGLEEPPPNELGVADGFMTLSGERTEQELPSMQNENAKTNDFQPQSDGRGNAFDPTATNTGALRGVRPQAVHNASSWGYRKFANDNRSLSSNAPLRLKSDDVGVQRPTRSLQFWHT